MLRIAKLRFLLVIGLVLTAGIAMAQQPKIDTVKLVNGGDYLTTGQRGDSVRFIKFIGSPSNRVVFQQKETFIYSDSAYLFRAQNSVEAYGNVKVVHQDTITVTGKKLTYQGNIKLARMLENAKYQDPGLTITSDTLKYDMLNNLASYLNNGKLVDERNTLTSEIGQYFTNQKLAAFKKDVVLVNPEYYLYSDTLQYNTAERVAIFKGPTTIISREDSTIIRAKAGGRYETEAKQTSFGRATIETPSYVIEGDELYSDDINKYYSATSNVRMVSKEQDVVITGEYGRYWREQGLTKIYGEPMMQKYVPDDDDTLFLLADTLVSIESEIEAEERMLAYHNVRIYKTDLQGIADSMAYMLADSVINFYQDPVLWYDQTQIEADSIKMLISGKGLKELQMNVNSFLITRDTLNNPNQIKGREMTAYFKKNKLDQLLVFGNAESLLYALNDDETATIGVNKTLASRMKMSFNDKGFDQAYFYTKPEAAFIPPHELKETNRRLKGFVWRTEERPKRDRLREKLHKVNYEPDEIKDGSQPEQIMDKIKELAPENMELRKSADKRSNN